MVVGDVVSCPHCGHLRSRVVKVEHPEPDDLRRRDTYRLRRCLACGDHYATHAAERVIGTYRHMAFAIRFGSST